MARTNRAGRKAAGDGDENAAQVALLATGCLPGTGIARTNAEIFNAVASGDTLTVGIEIDNGKTLERTYKRKKDGAIGCDKLADERQHEVWSTCASASAQPPCTARCSSRPMQP